MSIILLNSSITAKEMACLVEEFPQYTPITAFSEAFSTKNELCDLIEIIYGDSVTADDIERSPRLRWIHTPGPSIKELYLEEIRRRDNILITTTNENNVDNIGEYVISATLAFAKGLFLWHSTAQSDESWKSSTKERILSFKNKRFLQIGLGHVGGEIARRAKELGFTVWGAQQRRTFHPSCNKTFALSGVSSLLGSADIISIHVPRDGSCRYILDAEALNLMKEGAILIITNLNDAIDVDALTAVAGKFRGIALDIFEEHTLPSSSPLWDIPSVLITPHIATYPESSENHSFSTFLYNLRQFSLGSTGEMKNLLEESYHVI